MAEAGVDRGPFASARQQVRAFNDAVSANAGPWEMQALGIGVLFAIAGWNVVWNSSVWTAAAFFFVGVARVRPVARVRQRQRQERRRRAPDLRRPD